MRAVALMVNAELDHTRRPWVGAAPVASIDDVMAGGGEENYAEGNQQSLLVS
jgi:hypothetical protein